MICLILLWVGCEAAFAASKHALLIGIENYSGSISRLNGPRQDVLNVYEFLTNYGGYEDQDIKMLIDQDATKENILHNFDMLASSSQAEDDVFIYYSGHGSQIKDTDFDESDNLDETLVPIDTRLQNQQFLNMITDDEFRNKLSMIDAADIQVIIDSCHSGTITRNISMVTDDMVSVSKTIYPELSPDFDYQSSYSERRKEPTYIGVNRDQNISVWTAVSSSQLAFTDVETKSGSLFTNRLLQGLKNRSADFNNDNVVNNFELLEYLRNESDAFCRRNDKLCVLGVSPTFESNSKKIVDPVRFYQPDGEVQITSNHPVSYVDGLAHHQNRYEIDVTIQPENLIKVGQEIQLEITTPVSGYLIVLDIDSQGQLTQLYPNIYSTTLWNRPLPENTRVRLPEEGYGFDFIASTPYGDGHIVTIVMEDESEFSSLLKQNLTLKRVDNVDHYLAELIYALQEISTSDQFNRRTRWSVNVNDYSIVM